MYVPPCKIEFQPFKSNGRTHSWRFSTFYRYSSIEYLWSIPCVQRAATPVRCRGRPRHQYNADRIANWWPTLCVWSLCDRTRIWFLTWWVIDQMLYVFADFVHCSFCCTCCRLVTIIFVASGHSPQDYLSIQHEFQKLEHRRSKSAPTLLPVVDYQVYYV